MLNMNSNGINLSILKIETSHYSIFKQRLLFYFKSDEADVKKLIFVNFQVRYIYTITVHIHHAINCLRITFILLNEKFMGTKRDFRGPYQSYSTVTENILV